MIQYKKYQDKNAKSAAYNKWYGRAVHELMEFDEFIEHMANHHCVFSEGIIKGVLIEMQFCLRELLLLGKGYDRQIMRLIGAQRERMLEAIEGLE